MTEEQKNALWEQRIREQKESGLTQKKFCEKNSLNYSAFKQYLYRERAKKRGQGEKQFIPLKVNHATSSFQIRASGVEFSFSNLPDTEWLAALIKKLSQRHA